MNSVINNLEKKAKVSIRGIDVLYDVMPKLGEQIKEGDSYEEHPSVVSLCHFWNSKVPKNLQAQGFNVYFRNPRKNKNYFVAGDPEEPSLFGEDLEKMAESMLFLNDDHIQIAFIFFKGREYYERKDREVSVFQCNGDVLLSQQEFDESPLDQALYSLKGLRSLLNEMCSIDCMSEGVDEWDFSKLFDFNLIGYNE